MLMLVGGLFLFAFGILTIPHFLPIVIIFALIGRIFSSDSER